MKDLELEFTAQYSDSNNLMITPFSGSIKIYLEQDDLEEYKSLEIGHIKAYRFDLSYNYLDLTLAADHITQDVYYFANFFLQENPHLIEFSFYLFYLDRAFIQPEYRGKDYGLKALSIFLKLFAAGETVGCFPSPIEDLKDKYTDNRGKLIMKKYWSKLGLNKYESEQNILWTEQWNSPNWLEEQISKS
ncbi:MULTISPECIES: hypothetical protein [Pseudanabaena]|nr:MULTISPECIES: hypothetical protein [Pseudanabaena]MDG3493161.1 hypothetical protein [Pseudanabaena catenata USMAC16]